MHSAYAVRRRIRDAKTQRAKYNNVGSDPAVRTKRAVKGALKFALLQAFKNRLFLKFLLRADRKNQLFKNFFARLNFKIGSLKFSSVRALGIPPFLKF